MNNTKATNKGITIKVKPKDDHVLVTDKGLVIQRQGKPVSIQQAESGYVYLLLDCSSSMDSWDKMKQAKSGALNFTQSALNDRYSVGLIEFNTFASTLCEPTRDLKSLNHHINSLYAYGSTNMAEAITLAQQQLINKSGFLVMVIITDGEPNSRTDTLVEADKAKKNNIDIITVGTDDADESFLSMLASRSDLVKVVPRNNLARSIASTANLLPIPRTVD